MHVEKPKTFAHGFRLTEEALRSIHKKIHDSCTNLQGPSAPVPSFTFKLDSGTVVEGPSLDEILKTTSLRSSRVTRLRIDSGHDRVGDRNLIEIEFVDVDAEEEDGCVSVHLLVRDQNDDWVLATSALLEKEVATVRRCALNELLARGTLSRLALWVPLAILVAMCAILSVTAIASQPDALDVSILIGKVKWLDVQGSMMLIIFMRILIVALALLVITVVFVWLYYPPYLFFIGELTHIHEKRLQQLKAILLALVVGVIASAIVAWWWSPRTTP